MKTPQFYYTWGNEPTGYVCISSEVQNAMSEPEIIELLKKYKLYETNN